MKEDGKVFENINEKIIQAILFLTNWKLVTQVFINTGSDKMKLKQSQCINYKTNNFCIVTYS